MTFAWPWALAALLALPALVAIYWLRQRARRRPVSSLLLWRDAPESRASGRRVERFEASRLLPLELLILTLLILAAAGPRWPVRDARRPLIVVLDDSFSMLAGEEVAAVSVADPKSPRQLAGEALMRELESGRHRDVTLILAGERPQVLGEGRVSPEAVAGLLESWRASAATSQLEPAVALAADLGGGRARLWVLSDRAPPPIDGALVWWAFGRDASNLALVSAMRRPNASADAFDRCQVEIANFSLVAAEVWLEATHGQASPQRSRLEIAAGDLGRTRLQIPADQDVELRLVQANGEPLLNDALDLDDRALLLPERQRAVRVGLEIRDSELRSSIRQTLAASDRALWVTEQPELVITDEFSDTPTPAWRLRLITGGAAKPYLGPFVLDRGHPLTSGLSLDGVIWGAGSAPPETSGDPVLAAGEVPLLVDLEASGGRHELTLFWQPGQSTVQRTPNWPILWWNLLDWRSQSVPGVPAPNLRLGGTASVGLVGGDGPVELELPDGLKRRLETREGRLEIQAEQLGVHRLHQGGRTDRWVVNALAAEESDLREAVSGRWGNWSDGPTERWEVRSAAWILLLLAAAGLVLHLAWSGGRR